MIKLPKIKDNKKSNQDDSDVGLTTLSNEQPDEPAQENIGHEGKYDDSKTPLLVFDRVSKEYSENFKALDNVSFSLDKGEFVFLIGKSGAGKSTLIKLLIREQELTSGNIIFDGINISSVPKKNFFLLRRRIGVVFQDFKVLYSKNVFDNVAVALEVVNAPKDEVEEVVSNVLNLVGLLNKSNNYPNELSGGELQRLVIARALANEPDLLVADEPTGNIDPLSANQIVEIFEKANKMGVSVLMATHDERIVNHLNKRVIKLEEGRVVFDKKEGKYA